VEARFENPNATKDQQRLMMQALLADRFKLTVHFETRELPVLGLVLLKPGVLGPKLLPHEKGPACDAVPTISAEKVPSFFPTECDTQAMRNVGGHALMMGSRNSTMAVLAGSLNSAGGLGKPVVDRTGLIGRYDFRLEWTLDEPGSPAADGPDTTFLEALKDQLGMKLEPIRAPVKVLVVDHLERPSEN
jgi:uncharacterized protein (TIGR03435 family)